jgi:hypothetical protein
MTMMDDILVSHSDCLLSLFQHLVAAQSENVNNTKKPKVQTPKLQARLGYLTLLQFHPLKWTATTHTVGAELNSPLFIDRISSAALDSFHARDNGSWVTGT